MHKYKIFEFAIVSLCCFFVVANFLYWGNRKEVTFCDEFYTYESANAEEEYRELYKRDVWRSGEWLNNYIAATDKDPDFGSISRNLWEDHVPLYFWIFRLVSIVFFFESNTKWIGLSLNLFFLIGLFFGIFWVLHNMAKRSLIVSAIGAMAYGVHPLILNQALTIRMYLMLQCIVLFMLIVFSKLFCGKRDKKLYIWLFCGSVAGCLTHYHFWVYLAVSSFLYCLYLFIKKNYKEIRRFILIMAAVAGTVTLIFPFWLKNLFVKNGARSLVKAVKFWKGNLIKEIIWGVSRILIDVSTFGRVSYMAEIYQDGTLGITSGIIIITLIAVIVVLMVYILKAREAQERTLFILGIAASIVYAIVVAHTMPAGYEGRYIWPASGIILLLVIISLLSISESFIKEENRRLRYTGSIFVAIVVFGVSISAACDGKKLNYVNGNEKERKEIISQYKDIPCVIYSKEMGWKEVSSYWDYILFDNVCLTHEEVGGGESLTQVLKEKGELIVYINEDETSSLEEFDADKLFQSSYLEVYLVKPS